MIYQIVFLTFGVACVLGAPTSAVPSDKQQPTVIPIISQSEELQSNGTYSFSYETGNGIKREETSYDKVLPKAAGRSHNSEEGGESDESDESNEIHVQQGSYSYTAPDGSLITVRYIADENGFRPVGSHLPRAPSPISTASNEKTGRTLKQQDNDDSESVQSLSVQPSQETIPAIAARSATEPPQNKPAEITPMDSSKNEKEPESATKSSPSVEKSEPVTTISSQPEQKTETTESATAVSSQSNNTSEPTESVSTSMPEDKKDDLEPENKTESSTPTVTEEKTSKSPDLTESTSFASNERTTEPSTGESATVSDALTTSVSDNTTTEPSGLITTTVVGKEITENSEATTASTEPITQEVTVLPTSTETAITEEVSTSSSSAI
ncbi:unnamed protein product, partial [Iphiclides podalirius]